MMNSIKHPPKCVRLKTRNTFQSIKCIVPFNKLKSSMAIFSVSLLFIAYLYSSNVNSSLFYYSDFETGTIYHPDENPDGWLVRGLDGEVKVQTNGTDPVTGKEVPIRSGNYSVRMHIDYSKDYSGFQGGKDKPRNDLNKYPTEWRLEYNKDYWMALSVFLPADWKDDYSNNHEVLMQLHNQGGGPPIIELVIRGTTWDFDNNWDPKKTVYDSSTVTHKKIYSKPISNDKGKWTDWAMKFRLCSEPKCDGVIKIYKNGVLELTYRGPNAYKIDPNKGPFFSVNLYKGAWKKNPTKVKKRTIYFDEFRLGLSNSSLEEVSPPEAAQPEASPPSPPGNLTAE